MGLDHGGNGYFESQPVLRHQHTHTISMSDLLAGPGMAHLRQRRQVG
jgi:hypothetical protein